MRRLDENKALVIFSGGQDSTACLGWAIKKWGREQIMAITFDYGQRHKVEIDVAKELAVSLDVNHMIFKFDLFSNLGDSALVKSEGSIDGKSDDLPVTFVPGRNIMFLNIASVIAYKDNIANILIGVSSADYSGYPDCRPKFIESMQTSLTKGLEANIQIHAPLQHKTKAETFMFADECGVLKEVLDSHTCYNGIRDIKHSWGHGCGSCAACALRKKGYQEFIKMGNKHR